MPPTPLRTKQYKLEKKAKGLCRDCTRPHEEGKTTCPRCTMRYREGCLQWWYGISLPQYQEMVEESEYTCYICQEKPVTKRLFVDHCHTTGTVRGLLCVKCNSGISSFRDNPEVLKRAISYLSTDWESRGWVVPQTRANRKRVSK